MNAISELRKELEAAKLEQKRVNDAYEIADRANREAQKRAEFAYDARARNQRNVDRYGAAILALEAEEF